VSLPLRSFSVRFSKGLMLTSKAVSDSGSDTVDSLDLTLDPPLYDPLCEAFSLLFSFEAILFLEILLFPYKLEYILSVSFLLIETNS
jgi:hypothetical protein